MNAKMDSNYNFLLGFMILLVMHPFDEIYESMTQLLVRYMKAVENRHQALNLIIDTFVSFIRSKLTKESKNFLPAK
jgi:hypothetical protein